MTRAVDTTSRAQRLSLSTPPGYRQLPTRGASPFKLMEYATCPAAAATAAANRYLSAPARWPGPYQFISHNYI